MKTIISLLAFIYVVWVFIEFQSLVDGPGMSFVGGMICQQASQTLCDSVLVNCVATLKRYWAGVYILADIETGFMTLALELYKGRLIDNAVLYMQEKAKGSSVLSWRFGSSELAELQKSTWQDPQQERGHLRIHSLFIEINWHKNTKFVNIDA